MDLFNTPMEYITEDDGLKGTAVKRNAITNV